MRFSLRLLLSLLAGASAAFGQIAIQNAWIFDGSGAPPFRGSVVIADGRIAAAGSNPAIPADARIIDAAGKTLLPGLFDLHTHLTYSAVRGLAGDWPKNLAAYLYCGVTSVVEFGAYPEQFEPMRRLLEDGAVAGPRIHFAARLAPPLGHGLEGGRGDYFTYAVATPEDAEAALERLVPFRPDAIKIFNDGWRYGYAPPMADMTRKTLAAIADGARERGWETLTHTVTVAGAWDAAAAGVDVIAHGVSDAEADAETIELLLERGTYYAPTLAVYHPRGRNILDPLLEAVVPPESRAAIRPPLQPPSGAAHLVGAYDDPTSPRARRWKALLLNNGKLRRAGANFGLGTDAGVTSAWHGWSTLRELRLLVYGGLTPLEALAAATGNSAKALNVDGERGFIAAGQRADLLLVDGRPDADIDHIQRIEKVFFDGEEVDRDALAALIREPGPAPLPARKATGLLDDFESPGRRSRIGTNWVNRTDPGHERAAMLFEKTLRPGGGRALTILARMSQEKRPWAAVVLPLTPGQVAPADVTAARGIQFETRGEGEYALRIMTRGVRNYDYPEAAFDAGAEWSVVRLPFAAFQNGGAAWTGTDVLSLLFVIERPAGEAGWLELDNIRFF